VNGALTWVQQLPEGQTKQQAMMNLGSQWAQTDPQAALAYAQEPAAWQHEKLPARQYRRQLARQDPQTAMNYVQNLVGRT